MIDSYEDVLKFATVAHKGQKRRNKFKCDHCNGSGIYESINSDKTVNKSVCGACNGKGHYHPDYITHPIAVSDIAEKLATKYVTQNHDQFYGEDPPRNGAAFIHTIRLAALLHDVLEDTDYEKEDLEKLFDKEIVETVRWVTCADGVDYFSFTRGIIEFASLEAKILKISDLTHNLSDAEGNVSKNKILLYKLSKYILERDLGLENETNLS